MGGDYHALLVQLALAGGLSLAGFFGLLAWDGARAAVNGSVLAARLASRLPSFGALFASATAWYAAAELVEGQHHAGVPWLAIPVALAATCWLLRRLSRFALAVLAGAIVAVARTNFAPRTPTWSRFTTQTTPVRPMLWVRRRFARPPPIGSATALNAHALPVAKKAALFPIEGAPCPDLSRRSSPFSRFFAMRFQQRRPSPDWSAERSRSTASRSRTRPSPWKAKARSSPRRPETTAGTSSRRCRSDSYRITATLKGIPEVHADVTLAGGTVATVDLPLSTLRQIAQTVVTAHAGAATNPPSVHQIDRAQIQTSPSPKQPRPDARDAAGRRPVLVQRTGDQRVPWRLV